MKKLAVLAAILLAPLLARAQDGIDPQTGLNGLFMGGVGISVIDENGVKTTYVTVNLQPDVAISKLGFGLNIDILYNPEAEEGEDQYRTDDLKLEKIVRYVRWGQKRDPLYARVGALDRASLGHGFIMANYNNQIIENERKLGLEFDINTDVAGVETFMNNFKRKEVFGGRLYARPLKSWLGIPIVKGLAFGGTAVTDLDPDGREDSDDDVLIYGADTELPLIDTDVFQLILYGDYAEIRDYGSGTAAGVQFNLPISSNMLHATLNVERRFMEDQFISQYFNAFYEVNRLSRAQSIAAAKAVNGTFGALNAQIAQKITVVGAYEYLDDTAFGGIAHAEARLDPNAIPRITAWGTYDQTGIETLEDLVRLDERSIANAYVGLGLTSYLFLTLHYQWTFSRDENDLLVIHERMTPRLDITFNF